MPVCNACAGEQVRFINEKQMVSGCVYCSSVSLYLVGFIKDPSLHCTCYAKDPIRHLAEHRNTKMIGHNFNIPDKNDMPSPPPETQQVIDVFD
jgi:hypothetical protein